MSKAMVFRKDEKREKKKDNVFAFLNLGKKSLELTTLLEFEEIVASTNVGLGDEDVGNGALASQLLEILLNGSTIVFVVKLKDKSRSSELGQQILGLGAVRAVRL
jgi:hypothetical protein